MVVRVAIALLFGLSVLARADVAYGEAVCPEPDAEPKPLRRQAPAFPHVAALMCLQGTVVVEFTVAADGEIQDPSVIDADQPGIFDRAALDAVQQWTYRPGCKNAEPVAMQQRTAIDFGFEQDFHLECAPGADLLTDESLELAGSLGVLYSMLAEWHMHPEQTEWPERIRAEMVPGFDGDLGRVERFHHRAIEELLVLRERRFADTRPSIMQFFSLTHASGRPADGLPDGILGDVRAAQAYWTEAHLDNVAWIEQQFADLQAEVDLEPELLAVLVTPFLGDVTIGTGEQWTSWMRQREATNELLDLLEDPNVDWTLSGFGLAFEDREDQRNFARLMAEIMTLDLTRRSDMQRILLGFRDYRR